MARKLKRDNPANTPRTLKKLPGGGPVSSQDSLRHQAGKTMDYEYTKGNAQGKGLSNYGNPALNNPTREDAVNWYMTNIAPQLSPYKSAMEKGEAGDFLYNTGRDPKTYAYQEYLKKTDPTNTTKWQDTSGNWKDRKTTKGPELDSLYQNSVGKMSENDRRIMMNKGRDFYYKNINNPSPGVPNDAYENTWKGRIWNTNSYPGGGSIPHSETTQMFNRNIQDLDPNSDKQKAIALGNKLQQEKYNKEIELEKARLREYYSGNILGRKDKPITTKQERPTTHYIAKSKASGMTQPFVYDPNKKTYTPVTMDEYRRQKGDINNVVEYKLGGQHMNNQYQMGGPRSYQDYNHISAVPIMAAYGGSPCMTCGGAKMDEGGASNKNFNNPDFSQNQKNNFINWLKNTSMKKVHEEITNDHNQFIQDFTMKMMGGGLGQGDPSKGTRPEEINRPFKKNGGWTGINKQYPRYRLGAETHDFGGIYPELGKGGSTKDTTNNTPYFIKKADLIQEHKKALDLLSQLIPGYNTPLPIVNPQPNYQVHNQPQMAMNSGPLPDVDVSMDRHFKKGGHWIPKNLKKGRCTPLGNPDCRPGTPQYNLAVTFKKHHGFHKKNYGGDISIPNLEFGGDDTMAYGGQYPDGGSQMGPPIPDYDYTKQVPPGYVLEPDQPGFQDYGQQQPNPNTQSQPYGYNIPTNTNDAMAVTPYGGTNQDMQYSQNIQNNYANINNLSGANTRNKIVGNQRGMRNEANNPTMDPNYKLPSGNKGFNMNFSSPGPDTKIAGIEALTAFINQGQEKQKMKFLKDRTHADQLWNSQQGSRGDYSTNEGYFRPDQQVPVQFAGSAGLRKFGGISGPKKGDTLDLTEEQINQLISQGYKIKLA